MPSATLPRANRPDALCRHRVVNVNFRYPAHAMATSFGCSTGLVHCHVAAHRATTQPRALQRKKLLACSSIQSSFVGTHFVHKAKVHCSRTQARSSNRLEISAEQSYIMIKPDGVQRALVGEIITRFERKGFTLKALKMFTPSKQLAEEHYKDLSSKPFFGNLVEYIISGPVIAMVCLHLLAPYWRRQQHVACMRLTHVIYQAE